MKKIIIPVVLLLIGAMLCSCTSKSPVDEETIDPIVSQYLEETETGHDGKNTTANPENLIVNTEGEIKIKSISAKVKPGEIGTIAVQSSANVQFVVDIYDESGKPAVTESFRINADESGFASGSFKTSADTAPGNYILVARQDGTPYYLQTTFTVTK